MLLKGRVLRKGAEVSMGQEVKICAGKGPRDVQSWASPRQAALLMRALEWGGGTADEE